MESYIGTKQIKGRPMTRAEYNTYRGWELPADEDGTDEGMLKDDGKGHEQWDPIETFNIDFKASGEMTFGHAVELLKAGQKVARSGWNGKGMFVYLVGGSTFTVNRSPLNKFYLNGTEVTYRPHMDLVTADGSISTWAPSNSDALAEDWGVV